MIARLLLGILAFGLSGVAGAGDGTERSPLPVMTWGIRAPIYSLDPFAVGEVETYRALGQVLETLATVDPRTGELRPLLARDWELRPRTKSFIVRLRPEIHFHDGSPLRADDVTFTFKAYFDPAYGAQIWQGMWAGVDRVRAIDESRVEFVLKEWDYQTFETVLTSMRILPRSFYGVVDKEKFRQRVVGTGAYRSARFEPPRAWQIESSRLIIRFKNVGDEKAAREAKVDFYGPVLSPHEGDRAFNGLGQGFWVTLKLDHPLFTSRRVREALARAWRREDLNRQVFGGKMRLALDLFSPRTPFYPQGSTPPSDPQAARELLSQEGWRDADQDGVLEKEGRAFRFTLLLHTSFEERWATLLQQDLARVGVKMDLRLVTEDGEWFKRLREGKFEAYAGGGGLLNEVTHLAWGEDGPYNYARFRDAEVDRLTRELAREFSLSKRRLILRKLVSRVRARIPVLPGLWRADETYVVSDRLDVDPDRPGRAAFWKVR